MQVAYEALESITAAKELAAKHGGKVHIFMIHSKHFNTTKEPYAATVFKCMRVRCQTL